MIFTAKASFAVRKVLEDITPKATVFGSSPNYQNCYRPSSDTLISFLLLEHDPTRFRRNAKSFQLDQSTFSQTDC